MEKGQKSEEEIDASREEELLKRLEKISRDQQDALAKANALMGKAPATPPRPTPGKPRPMPGMPAPTAPVGPTTPPVFISQDDPLNPFNQQTPPPLPETKPKTEIERVKELEEEIASLDNKKATLKAYIKNLNFTKGKEKKLKTKELALIIETLNKKEIELDREKRLFLYYSVKKIKNPEHYFNQKKHKILDLRDLKDAVSPDEIRDYKFLYNREMKDEGYFTFSRSGFTLIIKNVKEVTTEKGIDNLSDKAIFKIIAPDGNVVSDDIHGGYNAMEIFREKVSEYNTKQEEEFNSKTRDEIRKELNTDLMGVGETPDSNEKDIKKEIADLTPEEKENLGWNLNTIGFKVEKLKNDFWVKSLNGGLKKINKQGTAGRFISELRDSFVRDGEEAKKKALEIKEGKDKSKMSKLLNVGLLSGNLLKYGRLIADATGMTPGSVQRMLMTTGMVTARFGEAAKEARFKNEKLQDQTVIQDADIAAEEAWRIYEEAKKMSPTGEVSSEKLKSSYLKEMPKDIAKRLGDPKVTLELIQKILRGHMGWSINRLNGKIKKIEEDAKLTPEEKENKTTKLLKSWEKNINDYDRMITQYGTVDAWASGARITQMTGKVIVFGTQAQTLYNTIINIPQLYERISHFFTSPDGVNARTGLGNKASSKGIMDKAKELTEQKKGGSSAPTKEIPKEVAEAGQEPQQAENNKTIVEEKNKVINAEPEQKTPSNPGAKGVEPNNPSTPPQETEVAKPQAPNSKISTEFTLQLGKEGVPKNLETVFTSLAADHMAIPVSGVDEEYATKALNMGANLVELSKGHSVAGIDAGAFAKIASFEDGALKVKDVDGLNEIIGKLQQKAEDSWDDGVLSRKGGASEYIGNINKEGWLKIVHADGLHEAGDAHTGIAGHADIDEEKIGDFKKINHEVINTEKDDAAWAKLIQDSSNDYPQNPDENTPEIEVARNRVTASYDEEIAKGDREIPNEDIHRDRVNIARRNIDYTESRRMDNSNIQNYTQETKQNIISKYPEFRKNPFKLTDEKFIKVFSIYKEDVDELTNTQYDRNTWMNCRDRNAIDLFKDKKTQNVRLLNYLRRIREHTNLKPKGYIPFWRRAETVKEYIIRALQKSASMEKDSN